VKEEPASPVIKDAGVELTGAPRPQLELELAELENTFLAVDGPLDDPRRLALWPQLATRYASLKKTDGSDAALCWTNFVWETPESQEKRLCDAVLQWIRSERVFNAAQISSADLDRVLGNEAPTPAEIRSISATVTLAALQKPSPDSIAK